MVESDIRFLLSLIPEGLKQDTPRGMPPTFYHGGSYEKELELSKRVKEIEDFYNAED